MNLNLTEEEKKTLTQILYHFAQSHNYDSKADTAVRLRCRLLHPDRPDVEAIDETWTKEFHEDTPIRTGAPARIILKLIKYIYKLEAAH